VQHSIREYCKRAKSRFEQCSTFDQTRQFLVEHIERVIYVHSKVTILGSVSFKRCTHQAPTSASFRIEGELDRKAIRAKPRKVLPDDGRWKKLEKTAQVDLSRARANHAIFDLNRRFLKAPFNTIRCMMIRIEGRKDESGKGRWRGGHEQYDDPYGRGWVFRRMSQSSFPRPHYTTRSGRSSSYSLL
jgi:hypothetical protein